MDLNLLRQHADECEAVAKERAQTEGGGLHYMNTCDWAYAIAFRGAADRLEKAEALIRQAIPSRSILTYEGVIDWQARRFEWLSDSASAPPGVEPGG